MVSRGTWLLVVALGCAEPPCDDMIAGEAGLRVTAGEHGLAWGEGSCDSCHLRSALHRRSCTPGVDLAAVREVQAAEGVTTCMECHGTNGVDQ